MYRVTVYDMMNEKTVDEMEDEDDMRDRVYQCLNDLEDRELKSFTVSRISEKRYEEKPFWEKE